MRKLKSPVAVVWEITNNCNFMCPHCRAYMAPSEDENAIEERILSEIIKNDVISVNLSGGEPLLNKRVTELVNRLSERNIDVGISSNGWLFEQKSEELIKNGLCFLQVSVDGTREQHDKFRGVEGAFDRAINALRIARKYGIRTQMNVTITSQNLNTLMYNIELAKKLDIDRIFFRRVVPVGKGDVNRYVLPEKEKYLKTITKISKLQIPNLDIAIDDPILTVMKKESEIELNSIGCTAGIKSLGISSKGDVYPCIFLREKLGNITEMDLAQIWDNSKLLKKLRNRDIGKCGACKYKFICGGCRAFSGIDNKDEMCPFD